MKEHTCPENDCSWVNIYLEEGEWWIDSERCCQIKITFCPYCGTNLYKETLQGRPEGSGTTE